MDPETTSTDNSEDAASAVESMVSTTETTETTEVTERPENVPGKFWDDEKKAVKHDDVLKSYTELESKFGSFTGAPDEYVAALSDEIKEQGVELIDDDPMVEHAKEFAKKAGMNQEGFSEMINLYAMAKLAETKASQEAMTADIASLGDNADRRINNLSQWANANLSADMQEGFKDLAVSADAVQALEQIISMTRNASVQVNEASPSPSITLEELQAVQFATDKDGNRLLQTSSEHKAKFKRMQEALHGTEPHHQMVG